MAEKRTEGQILELRGKVFQEMNDIKANAEGRAWTSDESVKFDKANEDFKAYTAEIDEIRASNKRTDEALAKAAEVIEVRKVNKSQKEVDLEKRHAEVFEKYVKGGEKMLSQDELRTLSSLYERRGTSTQVVGTDALGGYFVPEAWANDIIRGMKYYGGVLQSAKILTTDKGGTYHVPGYDDTSNTGALIAEAAADTVQDFATTEKLLNDYGFTSNIIKVSWELLNDSAYNVPSEVSAIVSERLGRVFNTYLTTGTGTAQPNGVVTAATASGVTAAASALDRDDLIDLIHSVDIAYRNSPGSRLMFSDSTLAAIKKLTVGSADDRPLWSPSMREGEPDRIDGVPYVINNDMASIGTGNISVLYGDFQKYCVRLVKGIQMVRLNELYAANRSVGFFAFARMDGELLDSKALKSLVHA